MFAKCRGKVFTRERERGGGGDGAAWCARSLKSGSLADDGIVRASAHDKCARGVDPSPDQTHKNGNVHSGNRVFELRIWMKEAERVPALSQGAMVTGGKQRRLTQALRCLQKRLPCS
eukprot:6197873-Pleurochrysis_carterae.AAC.2